MADLLLIRPRTEEAVRSPELRYLASCVLAAARQVFGTVEEIASEDAGILDKDTPLLVMTQENVHLGPASLERMRAALAAAHETSGAVVAVASRLASFSLEDEEPIHTLRGFERLERRLLDRQTTEDTANGTNDTASATNDTASATNDTGLQVALVAPGALPRLTELTALSPVVRAGVYHDYVDYYGEVREDVLPFVPDGARDVLEVGCGRGVTGELLERRRGCRVTGVELNAEVAKEAARRLSRVIVGDVEQLVFDELYDVVLATELFEHLNYPEVFLEKMRGVLRPGGRIVLSVPNVGHYSVVEDLLAGRWDYLPIGLLCYTHFRFFTRATLASWIERVGFARYEIVAQTTELPRRFSSLGGDTARDFEVDEESLRTKGFYVVLETR